MKKFCSLLPALALIALVPVPAHLPAFAAGETSNESSNKAIELGGLVLPVEYDGKLINYLFVSVMVTISSKYDQWEVREDAHEYRDLILKAAHKTTVGRAGKPMELDEAAFESLVRKVFNERLGPDSVAAINVVAVDSQKVFVDG